MINMFISIFLNDSILKIHILQWIYLLKVDNFSEIAVFVSIPSYTWATLVGTSYMM